MIKTEIQGHIAHVRLDRPDKRNAVDMSGWTGLAEAMGQIDENLDVRVVVLGGEGKSFCAGIDLMGMMQHLPVDPGGGPPDGAKSAAFQRFIRRLQQAVTAIERCRVPVIAAVQGHCVGGGLDIATAADIRLATVDAKFSVRETRMAMVADLGTLQRLPAIVGQGIARELAFTGRDVDAIEAARLGLVNRVVDDVGALRAAAQELAVQIAANAPLAVQGTKQVMNEAIRAETDRGLEYVATWNAAHLVTQDLGVAVTGFMTKQTPEFSGR